MSSLVARPDFGDEALTILVPLQDHPNLLYQLRTQAENQDLTKKNRETRAYHTLLVTIRYSVLTPAPESRLDALTEEVENFPSQHQESQAVGLFSLIPVHHLINYGSSVSRRSFSVSQRTTRVSLGINSVSLGTNSVSLRTTSVSLRIN